MMKIEKIILAMILTEAAFLLLFFKYSFANIILGLFLGIILIFLTKKIKKNITTNIILIISSITAYLLFLYKATIFISNTILKNYSLLVIIISLICLSLYLVKNGYHTFVKTTEILFYIITIFKFISFILIIPIININNFTLEFQYSYHLIYISLFVLYLYKSFYYLSDYQLKNRFILLSFLTPLKLKLISLLVIGNTLSTIYKYPYVNLLKKIKYLNFIERMDGLLSFEYLFCFIILISYTLLIIKKAIKWLLCNHVTYKSLTSKKIFLNRNITIN